MYIRTHASEGVNVSQSYIIRTENFHSSFSSSAKPCHTGTYVSYSVVLMSCWGGEGEGRGRGGGLAKFKNLLQIHS